jgi:hypothetical protein
MDQQDRERRRAEAAMRVAIKMQDVTLDARVEEVCRLADLLARSLLLAAGFHHHRGDWRKLRGEAEATE